MKHTRLLYVMMVAAAFAGNAEAIYKCTTSKGVVYQDRPCREGNETDVQIVVPTGEVAPKYLPSRDESAQAGAPRVDNRAAAAAAKPARAAANDQVSVGKPGERSANESTAADDTRRKDARSTADNGSNPMTAEQARKTDPTAKYYTISYLGARANGEFSTKRFQMPAAALLLNAAVPAPERAFARDQAYVMVGVLDDQGQTLPGFEAEKCVLRNQDRRDLPLKWGDASPSQLAGKAIRLRFFLRGANIYAVTLEK